MRYYYDYDYKKFITDDDLKAEYVEYFESGLTEAECAEDYIWNFLNYSGKEVTEKIYNERNEADEVRKAIKAHVASWHASWDIELSADGESWKLTIEGDPVCSIELKNVIPALDYLYSVIDMTTSDEEDIMAMCYMKSRWGL